MKKPLRPRWTRGERGRARWACARSVRAPDTGVARTCHRSHPSSMDLALSDVGRATRGVVDAAGSCPARGSGRLRAEPRGPATLAFALSRRGLFYPLASLDISGQWPVFEQEPHRNGRS